MTILLTSLIIFITFLLYEGIILNRYREAIPVRICVTGTRGKSSTVRMLASVLREQSIKTLAKTTGSEAQYIFPDGSVSPIRRRRIPSIIEQKYLLKKAVQTNAGCIVAEIMSIHPENHYVEAQQILKPHIVIITNIRLDHIEAMGATENEIASVLSLTIPEKAAVFIPEKELRQPFLAAAHKKKALVIHVQKGVSAPLMDYAPDIFKIGFPDTIDLIYAVSQYLNIPVTVISAGIKSAHLDIGAFKIWKHQTNGKTVYFVNAFAANDPESTSAVFSKMKELVPVDVNTYIGLLNLRADRADRTSQWLETLSNGASHWFQRIYVTGAYSSVIKRRITHTTILKSKQPDRIIEQILGETKDTAVIFGFGNIGGTGKELVDFWNTIGEPYGI